MPPPRPIPQTYPGELVYPRSLLRSSAAAIVLLLSIIYKIAIST